MNEIIEKLSSLLENLPGVGPRQAKRFVYHLVDEDDKYIEEIVVLLGKIKNIGRCELCFQPLESPQCPVCHDKKRERATILVVEKDLDFLNIEKSRNYNGLYFILGGAISPFKTNIGKLRLKELFLRLKNDAQIKETIIALSASAEGETTSRYIQKILEPIQKERGLKISRLGKGLHTGADLEYLDQETIKNALENRK